MPEHYQSCKIQLKGSTAYSKRRSNLFLRYCIQTRKHFSFYGRCLEVFQESSFIIPHCLQKIYVIRKTCKYAIIKLLSLATTNTDFYTRKAQTVAARVNLQTHNYTFTFSEGQCNVPCFSLLVEHFIFSCSLG